MIPPVSPPSPRPAAPTGSPAPERSRARAIGSPIVTEPRRTAREYAALIRLRPARGAPTRESAKAVGSVGARASSVSRQPRRRARRRQAARPRMPVTRWSPG